MQLPPSTCKADCVHAELNCMQCEHAIGTHQHFRNVERMEWKTMEFADLGPIHRACIKYLMLGYCPDKTRQLLAAEALAN